MRWLVMGDGGNIEGLYKTFAAQPNTCPCTPVNNDTYSNGCPCQDVSPSTLPAVRTAAVQSSSEGCLSCVLLARDIRSLAAALQLTNQGTLVGRFKRWPRLCGQMHAQKHRMWSSHLQCICLLLLGFVPIILVLH